MDEPEGEDEDDAPGCAVFLEEVFDGEDRDAQGDERFDAGGLWSDDSGGC